MNDHTTTMSLICQLTEDEIRDRAFRAGQLELLGINGGQQAVTA